MKSELVAILETILEFVRDTKTDITWSKWASHAEMMTELQELRVRLEQDDASQLEQLDLLFAPTGCLQEISIENGWSSEFSNSHSNTTG